MHMAPRRHRRHVCRSAASRCRTLRGRACARPRRSSARRSAKAEPLKQLKDRTFYAVGGTWRALAKLHMAQIGYPLHVMHGYTHTGARTC